MKLFGHILILCLVTSPAFAEQACDEQILPIRGMIKLLKAGLATGDLDRAMLPGYATLSKFDNPFASSERSIGNIFFRDKYGRLLRLLPETHIENFRTQVLELIKSEETQQALVQDAKIATAEIVGIGSTQDFNWLLPIGRWTKGTVQGRPVLAGYFQGSPASKELALFDPMNSDKSKRYVRLSDPFKIDQHRNSGGHFFRHENRDYFIDFADHQIYDLETGKAADLGKHFPGSIAGGLVISKTFAFSTTQNLRLVTLWNSPDNNGILKTIDLVGEGQNSREFFRDKQWLMFEAELFQVNGRAIMTYPPSEVGAVLRFFDVTNQPQEIGSLTSEKFKRSLTSTHNPLPFFSRSQPRAMVRYLDEKNLTYRMGVFNLQSRQLIKDIEVAGFDPKHYWSARYFEINKKPHALLTFADGLVAVDLMTKKSIWSIPTPIPMTYDIFEWKGVRYLFGVVAQSSEVFIYELETGLFHAKRHFPGLDVGNLVAFSHGETPRALLYLGPSTGSVLIDLTLKREEQ